MSPRNLLLFVVMVAIAAFAAPERASQADEPPSTTERSRFSLFGDDYDHLTDEELREKADELLKGLAEPPEELLGDSDALSRLVELTPRVLPVIQKYLETGTMYQRIQSIRLAGECRAPDKGTLLPAVVANLDYEIENEFVAEQFLSSTIRAIGNFGPEAAPYANKVAEYVKPNNSITIGCAAMEALGEIGKPVEIVLPALLEAAQHADSSMRQTAANALGSMGTESEDGTVKNQIIPALKALLADDSQYVRADAAEGLGIIGPRAKPATPDLVARLTDEHEAVRYCSAEALGEIGYSHPKIEQGLLALLARDSGELSELREALIALKKLGLSEEVDPAVILKVLRHEERVIRERADELLYHLRPSEQQLPKVLEQLLPLLEDEDSFVRGAVADSLGAMGKTRPAIVKAVLPILESENPTSRRLGVKIFEQIGQADKSALEKIKQMAKSDPDDEIREAASEASEWIDQEVDELVDDDEDVDI